MKQNSFIDPNYINKNDLPLIVFSSHSYNPISWLIKLRTKSNYNHVMILTEQGFASQGFPVFKLFPLSSYMRKNERLKFWQINNLTDEEKNMIQTRINNLLKKPWWKRIYDFFGIFGQAVGIKKINNPWTYFCSESVVAFLKNIIYGLPPHGSPEDLNINFKKNERMKVFGYWWND